MYTKCLYKIILKVNFLNKFLQVNLKFAFVSKHIYEKYIYSFIENCYVSAQILLEFTEFYSIFEFTQNSLYRSNKLT